MSVEKLAFSIIVAHLKIICHFSLATLKIFFVFDFQKFNYSAHIVTDLSTHPSYPSILECVEILESAVWYVSSFLFFSHFENFLITVSLYIASTIILCLLSFWDFSCSPTKTMCLSCFSCCFLYVPYFLLCFNLDAFYWPI